MVARIGWFTVVPAWKIAPRRLEILMLKRPDGGTVMLRPLNEIELAPTRPARPVGTNPLPKSTERMASRVVFALVSNRLVTETGRYTTRLPESTAPGIDPAHAS